MLNTQRTPEFEFTQKDFEDLRHIITSETGIQLPDHKKTLMYSRLARRLRALGLKSFADYSKHVQHELRAGHNEELGEMINAMTTNVTALFRENHHFEHLAKNLPHLVEKFKRVRIWSAACSTGEEPWSIAMVVGDFLRTHPNADVKITATDLDTTAVKKAEQGKFMVDPEIVKANPYMRKFFKATGEKPTMSFSKDEEFTVSDELRKLITFKQMNLLKPWPALESSFHVVFCRNVVIYFSKDTQRGLFRNIEQKMPTGSMLYIGHSESLLNVSTAYKLVGTTTYEKLGG